MKEAESDIHQKLVKVLIDKFVNDGLEIVKAAYEGYEEPYKVGAHKPDIIAQDKTTELFSIGEAKRCEDLTSDRTKQQFRDFSDQKMTGGKSTGVAVPFHIVVPKRCRNDVVPILVQLGIGSRTNIKIWNLE